MFFYNNMTNLRIYWVLLGLLRFYCFSRNSEMMSYLSNSVATSRFQGETHYNEQYEKTFKALRYHANVKFKS